MSRLIFLRLVGFGFTLSLASAAQTQGSVGGSQSPTLIPVPCASPAAKQPGYCATLRRAIAAGQAKLAAESALKDTPDSQAASDAQASASQDLNDALKLLREPASTETFIKAYGPSLVSLLEGNLASQGSAFNAAVDAWEKQRLDVQQGANPTAAGSTNLVVKSGVATLFSTAYQLGAFTQTTTGDTATFSINSGRFLRAIGQQSAVMPVDDATGAKLVAREAVAVKKATEAAQKKNLSQEETKKEVDKKARGSLNNHHFDFNNLEFTIGVDLNQQGTKSIPTSGSASTSTPDPGMIQLPSTGSKISSVTARYAVAAPFDPGSENFQAAFTKAYNEKRDAITKSADLLASAIDKTIVPLATFRERRDQYSPILRHDAETLDGPKLERDFQEYFDGFVLLAEQDPSFQDKVATAKIALASFQDLVDQVTTEARGGSPFTLEYDFNRPTNQPETHVARAIFAHQYNQALFSFNGALTLYGGKIGPDAKYHRVRDFQFSSGVDFPLGNAKTSILDCSVDAYVQYQMDPSVLNIAAGNLVPGTSITLPSDAQVLLGSSGVLAIAQVKFTINTKTGIKIPFAAKWSNKTALLDSSDVRGQFGISYDFASFSSLFGAKH